MMNDFSDRLIKIRKFGNITVTDLALWFGVKRSSVHQWIRGVTPSFGKQESLLCALGELESMFKHGRLPIPLEVSRAEHRLYIIELKKYAASSISKAHLASQRRKAVVGKRR